MWWRKKRKKRPDESSIARKMPKIVFENGVRDYVNLGGIFKELRDWSKSVSSVVLKLLNYCLRAQYLKVPKNALKYCRALNTACKRPYILRAATELVLECIFLLLDVC
jgi:hypothetical protein